MKAFYVRRDGPNVILRSETGQEKAFALSVFSGKSKRLLIDRALKDRKVSEEALELQKKLIGVWNTTDNSGFLVAFDIDWRIPLFGVQFPDGAALVDSSGFTVYEIVIGQGEPVIRSFRWEDQGDTPTDEWTIKTIDGEQLVLMGVQRQVKGATSLSPTDSKTVPAPFTRSNPTPPLPDVKE